MRSVRFIETHDGLSLAWARSGAGQPLIKAANWLTHLEYDDESPVWSHWVRFLETHFDYVRYDERGCGLSDRKTGELNTDSWSDDFERVVNMSGQHRPFAILAMSQGTAAAVRYAAKYPEAVSHLIIFGGYARGVYRRDNPKAASLYDAITDVFRMGWDMPNDAFRDVFTRRFLPDADNDRVRWFNDLCRRATAPDIGAELLKARGEMDVTDVLAKVKCPTLIVHSEGDQVVPLDEGKLLARSIPNAEYVVLPSSNHILQPEEPAWEQFCKLVLDFTGAGSPTDDLNLTAREQEVLAGLYAAKSNKEIARDLGTSEKTIRNQLTQIYRKLGVSGRQEAIVAPRQKG